MTMPMKRHTIMLPLLCLLLASCGEKKEYFVIPTLGVEVQGGTSGGANDPISTSGGGRYRNHSGGAYWGEGGSQVNSHYTPYSERGRRKDYYRGGE